MMSSSPRGNLKAGRMQTLGSPLNIQAKSSVKESCVNFTNKETKKKLFGTFREVAGTKKVVILCHGFASRRDGFHFPALAEALAKKQINSLRFDFSGNGDSEGKFEFGNYATEAKDIHSAATYLRGQRWEVIGLCGHSKGGNSALLYASIYDDIPNVVNIAGRFDLKAGVIERFGPEVMAKVQLDKEAEVTTRRDDGKVIAFSLTKWSLEDRWKLDMAAAAKNIRLSEVLTVHGSADKAIPVADAHQWGKYIATHQLQVVEGADHCFREPGHAQIMIDLAVQHFLPDA